MTSLVDEMAKVTWFGSVGSLRKFESNDFEWRLESCRFRLIEGHRICISAFLLQEQGDEGCRQGKEQDAKNTKYNFCFRWHQTLATLCSQGVEFIFCRAD